MGHHEVLKKPQGWLWEDGFIGLPKMKEDIKHFVHTCMKC
jgi:hypothetical protein